MHASGGGNYIYEVLGVLGMRVGVSLRATNAMADTAKAHKFINPDFEIVNVPPMRERPKT